MAFWGCGKVPPSDANEGLLNVLVKYSLGDVSLDVLAKGPLMCQRRTIDNPYWVRQRASWCVGDKPFGVLLKALLMWQKAH
ncbi:hypothetical protein GOBAR_DD07887 [Gossypium barbadense]|nr:hypothetical protein GOBAR_DD07887 [Gossypium barbadense]